MVYRKFKGRMDNNIQEIFPVGGVNQYIVLSANGMEKNPSCKNKGEKYAYELAGNIHRGSCF